MSLPTEHFVLKDGLIYWIEKMPESLFDNSPYGDEAEGYRKALQSAIDNAVQVSNQEETLRHIRRSFAKEKNASEVVMVAKGIFPEEGKVYSLQCSVEKKITYDPCNNQLCKDGFVKAFYSLQFCDVCKGTGGINPKTLALVTFSEPEPMKETQEELVRELLDIYHTYGQNMVSVRKISEKFTITRKQ